MTRKSVLNCLTGIVALCLLIAGALFVLYTDYDISIQDLSALTEAPTASPDGSSKDVAKVSGKKETPTPEAKKKQEPVTVKAGSQTLYVSGDRITVRNADGTEAPGSPLKLDAPVVKGPAVYDFSNRKKYNIVVLDSNGKIDMYNLQGEHHPRWKGITPPAGERFADLPLYVVKGSKSYWAAYTDNHTVIYPFWGGNPLKTLDGHKDEPSIKSKL